MPLRPPRLDDRSHADLVAELLSRIPAHTPEYTNPVPGDPGHTLIELFAWLTDSLLYRVNLIPERQRLEFLRLAGVSLRGARPAEGLIALSWRDLSKATAAVTTTKLGAWCTVKGPVSFETRRPVEVHPVEGRVYHKRRLTDEEADAIAPLLSDLATLYDLGDATPLPYQTTPSFPKGKARPLGIDLASDCIDGAIWVALLAGRPDQRDAARTALATGSSEARTVLTLGIVPAEPAEESTRPDLTMGAGTARPHSVVYEVASASDDGPRYLALEVLHDGTNGWTRPGVVDVALPAESFLIPPDNDVRNNIDAGKGTMPPRLEEDDLNDRLVAWLRLRPTVEVDRLPLAWVGVHAVPVDQRRTFTDLVVGTSNGLADQQLRLPTSTVETDTLVLQVEEAGGWVTWTHVPQISLAGRDERVFALDDEEGILTFGDGIRGRAPSLGARVRVAFLRGGGGAEGNLPPDSLEGIDARTYTGRDVVSRPLQLSQPVPTRGGAAAESLEQAERRIPDTLRHRERAVTTEDYAAVAAATPGVRLGRVEVLPGFKPHQRRTEVPGVVSVMVLPRTSGFLPPAPRPSRHTIEAVHAWLSARVPLATELYVVSPEYKPIGLAIAYELREGFEEDVTNAAVRAAVRGMLWPLSPGGPFEDASGWPRGRAVRDRELEVAIARVPGVDEVIGVSLFQPTRSGAWVKVAPGADGAAQITMATYQLPELLQLSVAATDEAPTSLDGSGAGGSSTGGSEVAIPVVPELC